MEHPPKMNWHIEKDGIIIAKGNGVLKYADISNYYTYSSYIEDMEKFIVEAGFSGIDKCVVPKGNFKRHILVCV